MAAVPMTVLELTRVTGDVDVTNAPAVTGAVGTPYLFPNDGKTFLACTGGLVGCVITFAGYNDEYGRPAASFTFAVGVGLFAIVGPFSPVLWDDVDGNVSFTISAANADDTFMAVRITDSGLNGV